MLYEKNILIA